MAPDDRYDALRTLVVAVKARVRRLQEGVHGGQALTMGDVTAALPPPQRKRGEPRPGGRQGQPDQPFGRGADHGFDGIIRMGSRVIPRHSARARGMRVEQGWQPVGDRLAPVAAAAQHHGCPWRIVDRAQPLPRVGWPGGGAHHVLTPRAPQGAPGGQPPDIDFLGIVKPLSGGQPVAGVCNRLLFRADCGAGLLRWCWGRRSTRPAGFRARRTVSSEPRMRVGSARSATRRWSVQREQGNPKLRGRRRTAASNAAR
jgi:hypothetical protein